MIKCFVIFDTINHIIFLEEDLRGPSTGKAKKVEVTRLLLHCYHNFLNWGCMCWKNLDVKTTRLRFLWQGLKNMLSTIITVSQVTTKTS